ncbi:outer membrane protein transport protein [Gramella sp. GC03-9]|uniref:Outer membrane protein transport protein n=1 Tax=Christiangramia oceanisediminis TaxID=2920386 RepID=A0A9X2KZX2_9FLAO|nr:outer membrane protein transport protein [Gramella oceanisediminis]MCP9201440.1 outer membrane protein transport protein [Gramella oceanisediminis]
MKKILSILFPIFILSPLLQAQDLKDAYRYSSNELSGTARFISMAGAFGALGGDLSAMSINPASSAVFISSNASVSMEYRDLESSIRYNNGMSGSELSDIELGNIGGVFVFSNNGSNDWRKFSLGINYNSTAIYDDSFRIQGTSGNSIDQYFLNYANGVELELLQTGRNGNIDERYAVLGEQYGFPVQQAFLGYQAYVIEPENDEPQNLDYFSLIGPGSFDQRYNQISTGLNGKLSFNLGTQFRDFLYLGLNLNSHFINYENVSEFSEFNNNPGSATTEVFFGNSLYTNGDGFSFQLGGIIKLDELRLGLTYDSPTWYSIREETTQYLETNTPEDDFVSVAPNILNIYPAYRLRTPSRLAGSIAYLFGRKGLISFDYSYKDYGSTEFRPENDPAYQDLNSQISSNMKAASTYRVGGEYRISNFSLRAGYRFEESPFENENRVGNVTGYTGGIGYNFGNINLDLAYSYMNQEENMPIFNTGLTDPISFDRELSKVVLSVSFGL